MLQNTRELTGHKLAALDGDIGHVKDFYFDDKSWAIRYLVADTGTWLTGRLVLLPPRAFGKLDPLARTLAVRLLRKQIEKSPAIETHQPVSRQFEIEYYRYYGWPTYWNGDAMWSPGGYPAVLPPAKDDTESPLQHHREDKHLRSTQAVTGYHLQARDGMIGHVSGFMVDDQSWTICDLVVATGGWYSDREILVACGQVERISHEESRVFVNLTQSDIQLTADRAVAHGGTKTPAP